MAGALARVPRRPGEDEALRRKIDAEQYVVEVLHQLQVGPSVTPSAKPVTLGDYAAVWIERMRPTWRPATARGVGVSLNRHILPPAGRRRVGALRRTDVEAFLTSLRLAPSSVATVRQHLGQVLSAAVEDGLLPRSPATNARTAKVEERPLRVPPSNELATVLGVRPHGWASWCRSPPALASAAAARALDRRSHR